MAKMVFYWALIQHALLQRYCRSYLGTKHTVPGCGWDDVCFTQVLINSWSTHSLQEECEPSAAQARPGQARCFSEMSHFCCCLCCLLFHLTAFPHFTLITSNNAF